MKKWLVLALVSLCSNCLAHRHSQLCFHRLFPRFSLSQGKVGRCLPGLFLEQWEGGAVMQQRPWDACFHSTPKSSSQGNQSGIQAQTLGAAPSPFGIQWYLSTFSPHPSLCPGLFCRGGTVSAKGTSLKIYSLMILKVFCTLNNSMIL